MNALTHLTAHGIKSWAGETSADIEIPRLLAISGPNGAGKTGLIQSIKLGALGHDPAVGKTLSATRKLAAAGADIEVGLTFSNGFGIRRTIGDSTDTEVAPPEGEDTEAKRQQRINRETGAFIPSFDLASFLDLSAQKRREALFALLPRELARLDQDLFRRALGYKDGGAGVQKAIDKLWIEHVTAKESVVDGLASAIEYARLRTNDAETSRRDQVKVVDRLTELHSAAVERTESGDPEALGRLQSELSGVSEGLGAIREASERVRRITAEKEGHAQTIENLEKALADAESRHASANEALAKNPAGPAEEPADPSELENQLQVAKNRAQALQAEYDAAKQNETGVRAQLAAVQEQHDAIKDLEDCPTCGETAGIAKARASLSEKVGMLTLDLSAAEADTQAALAPYKEADAEGNRLIDALRELLASNAQIIQAEQDHAGRMMALKREADHAAEKVDWARERLEAERTRTFDVPEAPDTSALDDLYRRSAALNDQIKAEQQKLRAEGKIEAEAEQLAAEEMELSIRTARAKALSALHKDLQMLRSDVIEGMIAPVEESANRLLSAIDPEKTFRFIFERDGKDDFDLGFEEGGTFRGFDAASEGETAFLAVAFVAALIEAVDPAWKVLIIDNIERVDELRRVRLMNAIAAHADLFDNVIVAGCCEFSAVDGWGMLDLEPQLAEVA